MRRFPLPALFAVLAAIPAGCTAPPALEFADWTMPLAAGTPVREYAAVSLAERTETAFEVVDDLVIGGDPGDPNTAFYRPVAVVAADNGNIFVVENGGKRVQMFGPDGAFLRTLGQAGQGPGEFQMPISATIAGDRLVVVDATNSRFSVWADNGDHVGDYAIPFGTGAVRVDGLPDGRLAVLTSEIDLSSMGATPPAGGGLPTMTTVLSSYTAAGERVSRLLEVANAPLPNPMEMVNNPRVRLQYMIDRMDYPTPAFAVGSDNLVYVTLGVEYQIHALTPSGETAWALRVALPRRPFSESSKELRVRTLAREDPDTGVDDFEWPELDRAISGTLRTDGAGRLYVYPMFERVSADDNAEATDDAAGAAETTEAAGEAGARRGRPVDVYSPDGELIVAGLAAGTWSYARGDYVYRITSDPDTDETLVIRSRLVVHQR